MKKTLFDATRGSLNNTSILELLHMYLGLIDVLYICFIFVSFIVNSLKKD